MHQRGEGTTGSGVFRMVSEDRRCYIRHLRKAHDDERFRLALFDEMTAPAEEVDRLLFEAEMLANYGVV